MRTTTLTSDSGDGSPIPCCLVLRSSGFYIVSILLRQVDWKPGPRLAPKQVYSFVIPPLFLESSRISRPLPAVLVKRRSQGNHLRRLRGNRFRG